MTAISFEDAILMTDSINIARCSTSTATSVADDCDADADADADDDADADASSRRKQRRLLVETEVQSRCSAILNAFCRAGRY